MTEKIKLTNGPEKTVIWIWLENGQIKVEPYDFSRSAQRLFGNDIAYTITVKEMDKLLSTNNQNETSVIVWMEQYFKSYFGVKKWFEENEVTLVSKERIGLDHELSRMWRP